MPQHPQDATDWHPLPGRFLPYLALLFAGEEKSKISTSLVLIGSVSLAGTLPLLSCPGLPEHAHTGF